VAHGVIADLACAILAIDAGVAVGARRCAGSAAEQIGAFALAAVFGRLAGRTDGALARATAAAARAGFLAACAGAVAAHAGSLAAHAAAAWPVAAVTARSALGRRTPGAAAAAAAAATATAASACAGSSARSSGAASARTSG
jgi:hypothetical protein